MFFSECVRAHCTQKLGAHVTDSSVTGARKTIIMYIDSMLSLLVKVDSDKNIGLTARRLTLLEHSVPADHCHRRPSLSLGIDRLPQSSRVPPSQCRCRWRTYRDGLCRLVARFYRAAWNADAV